MCILVDLRLLAVLAAMLVLDASYLSLVCHLVCRKGRRNLDLAQAASCPVLQVGSVSIGKVAAPAWETRTALLHFRGMSKV